MCREVLGRTVETYLDSGDGSRDAAFTGTWNHKGQGSFSGRFVIQANFTSNRATNFKPSDGSAEVAKVKKLVEAGEYGTYPDGCHRIGLVGDLWRGALLLRPDGSIVGGPDPTAEDAIQESARMNGGEGSVDVGGKLLLGAV
jgi:hypothetical protein